MMSYSLILQAMRSSISIILILVLTACNLKNNDLVSEPISTVRLYGTVVGSPGGPITLVVPDPLAYDLPLVLDSITLDSAGNFSLTVTWDKPGHARINLVDYYLPLYLMPGDSLQITYNLEADEVAYTGSGAAVNTYLQEIDKLRDEFILYANLPLETFLPRLDSLTAARTDLLASLRPDALAEHADHPFLIIAQVEIEAARLEELMRYPWMYQFAINSTTRAELPEKITLEIEAYPLNNDAWFASSAYRSFVEQRLSDMISDTLKFERSVYEERRYRFADSLLTGQMREYMMAKAVQRPLKNGSGIEMGGILMERLSASHPTSRYLPYLQNLHEKAARVGIGRPAPTFTAVDLEGNTVSLSDLQGQLVYMDVWASWCLPCRRAIPDLVQLAGDMKDRPVEVVMISVDGDEASWRKLAIENPGPLHLWVEGGFSSTFAKEYNLNGVPQYMLLDRQGIILENNGPYPKGAKDKIEEHLQKESATS